VGRPRGGTPALSATRGRSAFLHAVFFLSGAAGLGYEIAWTRMWAPGLGHEVPAMLAVVAAFFGGLAVGARALDGAIGRSPRPGRWYVALEVVLGLWGLASVALVPWGNERVARLTGPLPSDLRHWLVAFAVPFALLLPATAAMGATLPAMDRLVARLRGSGRYVAGLYAVNTLGAVAGTLGAAFVLVPRLGLRGTVLCCAAMNLLAAAGAALGFRGGTAPARGLAEEADAPSQRRLLTTLFFTGLLGIGYEVLGVRVVGQVLENTVYSFACALAVYLLGTAGGAAFYQRFTRSAGGQRFEQRTTVLLHATGLACLAGILVLSRSREVYESVASAPGFARAIAAELALAACVFLLPSALMGATFAHLAQGARRPDGGLGAALSVNTLGGALAPLLFGVVLLPAIGARWSLVIVGLGYLPLIPRLSARTLWPALLGLSLVWLAPPDLRLVRPLPGGEIVEHRDGVMASVTVVSDEQGRKFLKVNDRFGMGGAVGIFAARRLGHLPLLLHPAPEQALFLGLGSGGSFRSSFWYPGLHARAVELLPEVVELRHHFETPEDRFDPRRQSIVAADARRYVRATDERYDVIVADLFHPARDGSGALYTREHFQAVAGRLAPGGLFCQWLPIYQLDPEVLEIVVRTFLDVYPDVEAYLADFNVLQPVLGLVGRSQPARHAAGWYDRRVSGPELRTALENVALRNEYQVLGCYLGGREALARFAGDGPLNLDDRPLVTYLAPRQVYARSSATRELLEAMLDLGPAAADLVAPGTPGHAELVERLEAYWRARDHFLHAQEAGTPEQRLELLFASLAASPDFATSYYTLLEDVEATATEHPDVALTVLEGLIEAHPHRTEAAALRMELLQRQR